MVTSAQLTIDEIGTPLRNATFVVVDLETDGGSPSNAGITEFGAVKIQGGQVLGEFASLVRLGAPLPPFITALTGISNSMLAGAPPLDEVLPAFLDFAAGAVIVAHNAPYDVGFLRGACEKLGLQWPSPPVLDTAKLARNALSRDEVPNCKLGTLAGFFRTSVTPNHRALADAQATVDVLHGLIERVGNLGVTSLEELQGFSSRVSDGVRRKRSLADDLPDGPGVYIFEDSKGVALYVGTSKSIRTRVRTYFTASEKRKRMSEMVRLAERVVAVPCATALEAQIRELRIIQARSPRYNRRSTRPQRAVWLKLTVERFPRISIVSQIRDDAGSGARYIGPFASRRTAESAQEAVNEALQLRTCSQPLTRKVKPSACVALDLGRCPAPCIGSICEGDYALIVAQAQSALTLDPQPIVDAISTRFTGLSGNQRYEDAATWRDRLGVLLRGIDEANFNQVLGQASQIVAARPTAEQGWEVHVIRHGRLAAACSVAPGVDPKGYVAAAVASAEAVEPVPAPATASIPEEAQILRKWLFSPGVRLVGLESEGLALPRLGAGRFTGQFTIDLRHRPAISGAHFNPCAAPGY